MYVNESALHDEVTQLIGYIEHQPDPISRLLAANLAKDDVVSRLLAIRDAAAYEARFQHSTREIEAATGLHPETLREYVKRHRAATQAPPPPKRAENRLLTALDASR